jgi:hypothetical protein
VIVGATPRDRVRTAAIRLILDGKLITRDELRTAGCRCSDELLGMLLGELIEDGTVRPEHLSAHHPARRGTLENSRCNRSMGASRSSREEERVELPPLRQHAPEVPPPHKVEAEQPIWSWLAERYWTERRRDLYKGAMV